MASAAAFLLLAIALFLWNRNSPKQLYAEATKTVYQERIYDKDIREGENRFADLFEAGSYEEALEEAKRQYEQANEVQQLQWKEREGFCYLELQQWEEALRIFKELEGNDLWLKESNPALWYQSLAYLGKGDIEQCKEKLKAILVLPKHDYQVVAKEMLADL